MPSAGQSLFLTANHVAGSNVTGSNWDSATAASSAGSFDRSAAVLWLETVYRCSNCTYPQPSFPHTPSGHLHWLRHHQAQPMHGIMWVLLFCSPAHTVCVVCNTMASYTSVRHSMHLVSVQAPGRLTCSKLARKLSIFGLLCICCAVDSKNASCTLLCAEVHCHACSPRVSETGEADRIKSRSTSPQVGARLASAVKRAR